MYLRNRENPSIKMSIRNIFLERIYLILEVTADLKDLKECSSVLGAPETDPHEQLWAPRLYVLLVECFSEWVKDSLKSKFKALEKQLLRLPKTIYFPQIAGDDISHSEFDAFVHQPPSGPHPLDFPLATDSPDLRNAASPIPRGSLAGLSRTVLASKENRAKMFDDLERLKNGYLNCVFSNNFSYKDLTRSQKAFATFYDSIRKEIYAFLKSNENSTNPKHAKTRTHLNFCNILVPYLSKTNEDLTTHKGLQRVRANILGFFQAAYREYPAEYLKMINEDQGTLRDARKEDIFVIKGQGVFGKRDIDKLYSRKEKEALEFSHSFHSGDSPTKQQSQGVDLALLRSDASKKGSVDPEAAQLSAEYEQLLKTRDQLKSQVASLNATYQQLLSEVQSP